MKNSRWSCKLTMKFVKLYLSKECLWNPKHPDYKDKLAKEKAYDDMIDAVKKHVNIDITGVRTKIKSLRCTYLQEVAKIMKKSTDPDNIYVPSLPWFREMDKYLRDVTNANVTRPDTKWMDQETYQEEHLDEEFLENMKQHQRDDNDDDSDISDFIYTDSFGTRWSSDITLKFVKSYLKHENLWNPGHPAYSNKKTKLRSFRDIINAMSKYVKLDINGVRTKIRSIRNTYNQELMKIVRKSTDPDHIYVPTMPWFRVMDEKLKDVIRIKSRLIKTDMKWHIPWKQQKDSCNKNDVDDDILRNIKTDVDCLDEDNMNEDDNNIIDSEDIEKDPVNALFIPSHDNKDTFFEDEYDIFGKYVAAQLRKVGLKPALQAKVEILGVLTKARLNASPHV